MRSFEQALIAIMAGGHALLIGVPGLGKTLLVETLGRVLGLDRRRIQFTPDLMPADITGSPKCWTMRAAAASSASCPAPSSANC